MYMVEFILHILLLDIYSVMTGDTDYCNLKNCSEYGRREGEYVNKKTDDNSTNLNSRTSIIIYTIWGL